MLHSVAYQGLGGKAGIDDYHAGCMRGSLVPPSHSSPDRKRVSRRIWSQIDQATERALALDAEDRYANAQDWLADIDQIQSDLRASSRRAKPLLDLFRR